MRTSLTVLALALCSVGVGAESARAQQPAPTQRELEEEIARLRKQVADALEAEQALQKKLLEVRMKPRGFIEAEVEGTLYLDPNTGYFLYIRPKDDPERETRVWLAVGEDKVLVQALDEAKGKLIKVKGSLQQHPLNHYGARIPAGGMYLSRFEIVPPPK